MKRRTLKAVSLLLSFSLICPLTFISSAVYSLADTQGSKDYTIISPYEDINWDTWGTYKTNLHTHSKASDGKFEIPEMVEEYYAQGFDVLAMTDHGVVNQGWNKDPEPVPIISYYAILKKPKILSQERYQQITTGSDRGGRGMTDIPKGIEMNAAVITKSHVNGFFAGYGQNMWGRERDYETAVAGTEAAGGVSFINHPGDLIDSPGDITKAQNPRNVKKYADIMKKYPSCLGIEIFNKTNNRTKHDRVLWDCILQSVIPTGRNVWGFSNSDAHYIDDVDTSFEVFKMPENNVDNVRTAMERGTFFAISRYPKYELPDDFQPQGKYPMVSRIEIDEENDSITIEGTDYNTIQWVANGNIIAQGNSIDLNDYEDIITCYVRAQLLGDGGVCLTQPFIVDDGNMQPLPEEPPNAIIEFIYDVLDAIKSTRIYNLFDFLIDELK